MFFTQQLSVIYAWIMMMYQVGQIPMFSVYMRMFDKVIEGNFYVYYLTEPMIIFIILKSF